MCGGPAIIFHRYHERNKTFIRKNENKVCKKIVGYDAIALYLWALSQNMPTGPFTIRKEENDFRLVKRDRYLKALYYLEWLKHNRNLDIDHYFNAGKEFRIGPYRVDGYSRAEKKVNEFNCCYFHSHDCELTAHIQGPKWQEEQKKIHKRDHERKEDIKSQGYNIEIIWECQYEELLKTCPEFKRYIDEQRRKRPIEHRATPRQSEIITAIRE